MGWYDVLLDWKVQVLLLLIIIAAGIATILIYLEQKVTKKRVTTIKKQEQNHYLTELQQQVHHKETTKEQLDTISKRAKEYFNEHYGTAIGNDYETLQEQFNKQKNNPFTTFCKTMFEIYYSKEDIEQQDIKKALQQFIEGYKKEQGITKKEVQELQNIQQITKPEQQKVLKQHIKRQHKQKTITKKVAPKKNLPTLQPYKKEKKKEHIKKIEQQQKVLKQHLKPQKTKQQGFLSRLFSNKTTTKKDIIEERKEWLKQLKKKEEQKTITGSKEWLKEMRTQLRVK